MSTMVQNMFIIDYFLSAQVPDNRFSQVTTHMRAEVRCLLICNATHILGDALNRLAELWDLSGCAIKMQWQASHVSQKTCQPLTLTETWYVMGEHVQTFKCSGISPWPPRKRGWSLMHTIDSYSYYFPYSYYIKRHFEDFKILGWTLNHNISILGLVY